MKKILLIIKLSTFFLLSSPLIAGNLNTIEPKYDKVYRSDRIADSYHFFLLSKNGMYYYVHTNKTDQLTASELKSPSILKILDKKQSWGQSFNASGGYIKKNGKIYTKKYWDHIKVFNTKKIKYLNKVFHIQ